MSPILIPVAWCVLTIGYAGLHFWHRWTIRHHVGSLAALLLCVMALMAPLLVLDPGVAEHRPVVLSIGGCGGALVALLIFQTRKRT